MSTLEFIRKNSILVLVVIAGVGAGLVMMDYGDKGSQFSRDFYIQVNDTNYSYPETAHLGENGQSYLHSLYSNTNTKLREKFDTNQDDQLSETELLAMQAWMGEHPEFAQFMEFTSSLLQNWSYGMADDAGVNTAVNRLILQSEAAHLGIIPSKEQIDTYIQSMPAFRKEDGSFDQEFYHRMTGFRDGAANNAQEKAFRGVVSDMMVWECLTNLLTDDLRYQSKTLSDLVDALSQKVSGRTAWLPATAVSEPAEPTEEELKTYWEQHKDHYKSEDQRIVSLYTLTPGEGSNVDALMMTADGLMQDLSLASGKGFDALVEAAAENPENEPFEYKNAEGATHTTYALSTMAKADAALKTEVEYNGKTMTLAEIAFREVPSAPTVEAYEAAVKAGKGEQLPSITQVRGCFVKDGKVLCLRVEAAVPPTTLSFEDARAAALADLKKERADHALEIAAHELYAAMEKSAAEGGLDAAMQKATEAGAEVKPFDSMGIGLNADADLPKGLEPQALLSVASGKLAPLVVLEDGARITGVTGRTVEESPEYTAAKAFSLLPSQNAQLRGNVLMDWLNDAYNRYHVVLSQHVKRNK